ncbi:FAD-dependent oxidoreductase [Protofrankia symbiont of Coriaria ruscifolia]|uniref:FAD-dependent oxidoreductase n=1 Tax=Protofrankia symbiont of Coriaria ruscifolia TaxID=1306542 RepID=UPI001A94F640
MSVVSRRRPRLVAVPAETDVLVLGGGPAGTWAALAAAGRGRRVTLADKGYCGTSGSTAAAGNNLWYLPPGGRSRTEAMAAREIAGGHLTDRQWMARVLDRTWEAVEQLAGWGYPFPVADDGTRQRGSLQGPEYMRLMRRQVRRAGVVILDQSPALELLADPDGVVTGAAGVRRQQAGERWQVRAGAVVLATGGCAFRSGALGLNVDTGDGALMAAELGAELSGMEFSCQYGIAPAFGAQTKGLMYQFAVFTDADGTELATAAFPGGLLDVQRAALHTQVYARLERAEPHLQEAMRWSQPNFFLPFDKLGIDPFTQRFPIRFVMEGTVRGTGGLRLVDDGCATTVPGLFVAGDAASRELVTGAISGGGSHNGSWAISSGSWAGAAAAGFAAGRPVGWPSAPLTPAGGAGLRAREGRGDLRYEEVVATVQDRVLPLRHNRFRTGTDLRESLAVLDSLWLAVVDGLAPSGDGHTVTPIREAAAMLAHARWMYRSALSRPESRGLQVRQDRPEADPALAHRIRVGGLDQVWTTAETITIPGLRRAEEVPVP